MRATTNATVGMPLYNLETLYTDSPPHIYGLSFLIAAWGASFSRPLTCGQQWCPRHRIGSFVISSPGWRSLRHAGTYADQGAAVHPLAAIPDARQRPTNLPAPTQSYRHQRQTQLDNRTCFPPLGAAIKQCLPWLPSRSHEMWGHCSFVSVHLCSCRRCPPYWYLGCNS